MNISVCIDAIFNGKDFIESLKVVNKLGIDTFEFWGWWNKDISRIKTVKEELGMNVATFCTRMVSLVDPSKRSEYLDGLRESITVAKELNCKSLITQVGNEIVGVSREEQYKSLVDGLKECVPILEQSGITLLVEPLNVQVDHMGYYLYSSREAFKIVEEVESPNIKVLFDIYHQQITEGNLISSISSNINKIGHFHAAGNPGRHELGVGEINYPEIIKAIDNMGYEGYLGLEYFPTKDVVEGLKEIAHLC